MVKTRNQRRSVGGRLLELADDKNVTHFVDEEEEKGKETFFNKRDKERREEKEEKEEEEEEKEKEEEKEEGKVTDDRSDNEESKENKKIPPKSTSQLSKKKPDPSPALPSHSVSSIRSPKPKSKDSSKRPQIIYEDFFGMDEAGNNLFKVPKTRDTLSLLFQFRNVPTLISWSCFVFTFFFFLYANYPELWSDTNLHKIIGRPMRGATVVIFIFWRMMYNFLLGGILAKQSEDQWLTKYVHKILRKKTSLRYKILNHIVSGSLYSDVPLDTMPSGLIAWLAFTQLVNIILPNDVFAFVTVFISYMDWSSCTNVIQVWNDSELNSNIVDNAFLCQLVTVVIATTGLLIAAMSLYGKYDAHKVVGHYAWFWGDFFFRADMSLKFEGVFDIIPHPMYTIGYGWMYGMAMVSRSYEVLAISLSSHLLQMYFLTYYETPHMEKLYGKEEFSSQHRLLEENGEKQMSEKESLIRIHKSNLFVTQNFDPFRAADWQLLSLIFSWSIVCFQNRDQSILVFALMAALTRIFVTAVLGYVLHYQSTTHFWTKHYEEIIGFKSYLHAFFEWKRLQNFLDVLSIFSFYVLVFKSGMDQLLTVKQDEHGHFVNIHSPIAFFYSKMPHTLIAHISDLDFESASQLDFTPDLNISNDGWFWVAMLLTSSMLIFLSIWTHNEIYAALGENGWFYGDFFLLDCDQQEKKTRVSVFYNGIYRYANNPELILGKTWLYAFALFVYSYEVFLVAIIYHVTSIAFANLIEGPHMKRLYRDQLRADSTSLSRKVKASASKFLVKARIYGES